MFYLAITNQDFNLKCKINEVSEDTGELEYSDRILAIYIINKILVSTKKKYNI
jgi:hypothetical protein